MSLDAARALVVRALSGDITRPMLDDDTLFFAVRALEAEEARWLLAQLAKPGATNEGRRAVLAEMSNPPKGAMPWNVSES